MIVIYTKTVIELKKILKLYQDQKIVKIQEVNHIVVEPANLDYYNNKLLKTAKQFDYRMWSRMPWNNKFTAWR